MNINGFIWSIADDVLHHVYDRTKYRDIILPMTVIRRLPSIPPGDDRAPLTPEIKVSGNSAFADAVDTTFRIRTGAHRNRRRSLWQ